MRPGQLRPGNSGEPPGSRCRTARASMRPGQLRPGNPLRGRELHPRPPASMRPGQLRPGNVTIWPSRSPAVVGFNEAGAASPRKRTRPASWPTPVWWGFNEAGAASPRKPSMWITFTPCPRAASMRPGQLRPGNLSVSVWSPAIRRSFNEAGAASPRKPRGAWAGPWGSCVLQ